MSGGARISVRGDMKAIVRDLNQVERKVVPSVAASSLTTIARKSRSRGLTHWAKVLKLPKKIMRGRTQVRRARPNDLYAHVRILTNKINLATKFPTVTKIRKRGPHVLKAGRYTFPGGFIQQPHGVPVIFKRKTKKRYPIEAGVLDPRAAGERTFSRLMRVYAARLWKPTFEQRLAKRLRKKGFTRTADRLAPEAS